MPSLRSTRTAASVRAASAYSLRAPALEPQKTQTRLIPDSELDPLAVAIVENDRGLLDRTVFDAVVIELGRRLSRIVADGALVQHERGGGVDDAVRVVVFAANHLHVRGRAARVDQDAALVLVPAQYRPVPLTGFEELALDHVVPGIPLGKAGNLAATLLQVGLDERRQFPHLLRFEVAEIGPILLDLLQPGLRGCRSGKRGRDCQSE